MALAELETALRLYLVGEDFYSVITLAGAADEIFGQLLRAEGRESSLETLKAAVVAIGLALGGTVVDPKAVALRANLARNALKHWSPGQPLVVPFDEVAEAKDMLNRAVDNFWTLEQKLSPAMERFQRQSMDPA
jgi:hypothetical protein